MFDVPSILAIITSIALVGCVGGSTRDEGPATFNHHAPVKEGNFQPLIETGNHHPIADIFVRDLSSNEADEVILGGRQAQPVTEKLFLAPNQQLNLVIPAEYLEEL
jgi:hypothetical protein